MMARLPESGAPGTRLALVGDPDQLASVEAGAVLADLVDGLAERDDTNRGAADFASFRRAIGALAAAIRVGDADRAVEVLRAGGEHIEWIDTGKLAAALRESVVPHALRLRQPAILADAPAALATLDERRLLCAHRRGRTGAALESAYRTLADGGDERSAAHEVVADVDVRPRNVVVLAPALIPKTPAGKLRRAFALALVN
jgi:exodeoxyribonuclease V alpha subunit